MGIQDSELIISRHDSVWERHVNKISLPARDPEANYKPPTQEETLVLFKKEGRRAISRITYRLEPKWGAWTMMEAWRNNDSIEKVISKLKAKYEIEGIYHRAKTEDVFIDSTDDQKERVRKYREERKVLEAQYINYPQHNSSKYSLFEKSETGIENGFTAIWPPEAVKEWNRVETLLDSLRRMVYR